MSRTHKDQGYMTVDLDRDVYIQRVPWYRNSTGTARAAGDSVHMLFEVSEGFGQIACRCCDALDSMTDMMTKANMMTKQRHMNRPSFPSYNMYDSLQLGDLRRSNYLKRLPR